ncbi:hypothetical protein H6F67_10030 [Microcoleus sp. FACHB-1515]|uniref:ankyrin repeat domain-containing protein n=1 Tax=Cyanophyceae TaxID=3028117 RepID=UPI0016884B22|nr:hypothetical protein [Microcoleus sp. FACHB-1515]MBD2090190.1 hypothetical protein [Microcoleus sp. FACHB-1515]
MSQTSRLVYALRFLVIPVWSISAFVLWLGIRILLLAWLAMLPKAIASVAIVLVSHVGIVVLICAAIGGSSLLLWQWLPTKLAAAVAVLLPVLLWMSTFTWGRIDTQGTDAYVLAPAQRADVQTTREQLVIKTAQYQMNWELQALIKLGTDVNARNPNGQSALYWARDPQQVKPLLQAGAIPDADSLLQAAFWGRVDTMKLLFAATGDDGEALVAQVGDQALEYATNVTASGEQDRTQIVQLLVARGAKPIADSSNGDRQ